MHDNHEPACSMCRKFVYHFDINSPLADWGYCADEVERGNISPEILKRVETQVKQGDYSFLGDLSLPLFQPMEEGCEKFEH